MANSVVPGRLKMSGTNKKGQATCKLAPKGLPQSEIRARRHSDQSLNPPVPLESVLCTEELERRPRRRPDYQRENRAMTALAQALAESPRTVLQKLADTILETIPAGSAAVSLLTKDGRRFFWPAIAGRWKPHTGKGTSRELGPCGDVLDRNTPLLFRHFERRYTYFQSLTPPVTESLWVPFYVEGKAVGTICALSHDSSRSFDAEDLRQLVNLSQFAASACQSVSALDAMQAQGNALQQSRVELAERVDELQKANVEIRHSRRAALNLMEDAVQSRQTTENLNVALRTSEEHLRTLFDSAPVAVFVCDTNAVIRHFNQRAVELWSRTPEAGVERHWGAVKATLSDGTPLSSERSPMMKVLRSGAAEKNIEAVIERQDGSCIMVIANFAALQDAKGAITGVITSFEDITQRKEQEEELRRVREGLERTVAERTATLRETIAELEAFSYSISHDMRAPLRSMLSVGQLALLEYGEQLGEEGRDYLERITTSAQRLDRLVQDILTYSRSARDELNLQRVDLARLFRDVIHDHEELQPARSDIEILEPLLPVLAHPAAMVQCAFNLLSNAVKFVPPSRKPHIRVRTEAIGGQVRVWFEDNGIGIEAADRERIFGLFERVHGAGNYEGTGVGLAIVRKAVERMGGTMGVESEPRQGSRFWIQLHRGGTYE